jgi:hypothetical protein
LFETVVDFNAYPDHLNPKKCYQKKRPAFCEK